MIQPRSVSDHSELVLIFEPAGTPDPSTIHLIGEVVTSPTFDPTSRPVDPGVEQPDPRLGEAVPPTGTFAKSEVEYPRTESSGEVSIGSEGASTVGTAKGEAANIKDTAAGAASGVKDAAKGEVSNVAGEAKYQARNLVDQTRSQLRGQVSNQQSQVASKLNSWASELGSMGAKSEDSGPMSNVAQEASRRVGEISHWLDNHEPSDLLDEVKRFARRRPGTFLALAAAAGVVAGRLTRGAVAANTSADSDTDVTPARAYDSVYDRGGYDRGLAGGGGYGTPSYQSGYEPRYGEVAGETSYQGGGMPAPGQYAGGTAAPGEYAGGTAASGEYAGGTAASGEYAGGTAASGEYAGGTAAPGEYPASGPAYPNVTPTTDEPYYPPPTEGEVRR
jgi:uncharacterized protein YjbJ (UPF0337 family)